jgi:cyclopropane fatty-acyl-phospholipid synthase-like methyltransferase
MQKEKTKIWYENESFWKTFAPTMFHRERVEATAAEVEQIVKLLNVNKTATILDLCCGIGRHSLELAQRGYNVVGVDLSKEYLAKARSKAKARGLNIKFLKDDMRRFCQLDYFDAAINMFTAFGYFDNPADDKRAVSNIYYSLRKGGTLIIDVIGKEIIARMFRSRDWDENNGRIFLQERKLDRDWSWIDNKWIVFENGKKREFEFGHRIYSAAELTALLKDCGFKSVKIFGDLSGADYDHNAKRLIAVAKK